MCRNDRAPSPASILFGVLLIICQYKILPVPSLLCFLVHKMWITHALQALQGQLGPLYEYGGSSWVVASKCPSIACFLEHAHRIQEKLGMGNGQSPEPHKGNQARKKLANGV